MPNVRIGDTVKIGRAYSSFAADAEGRYGVVVSLEDNDHMASVKVIGWSDAMCPIDCPCEHLFVTYRPGRIYQ